MPRLMPIRGLRYTTRAGALSELLAPPFDVIGPEEQRRLASLNPNNAVHLELAEPGEGRDARVAAELESWIAGGVIERDPEPRLYVYEQRFVEAGRELTRRALICGVESQPWEAGAVKPHEFTLSAPKADRLRLLQATRTQFSPTFMLARDRSGQLATLLARVAASRAPDAAGETADGASHRLWVEPAERGLLKQLAPLLSESFFIADGHHRYETSFAYRTWLAEQTGELAPDHPARFCMAGVVPASDPGLVVRPLHRIVPKPAPEAWAARLEAAFAIERVALPTSAGEREARLQKLLDSHPPAMIGLGFEPDAAHLLTPHGDEAVAALAPGDATVQWTAIQPNLLRYGVLNPLWEMTDEEIRGGLVEYTHEIGEVLTALERRQGSTAFLLHPVSAGEVIDIADGGERLPQKSTFFHPKLGTGLVFYPLEP